jgi:hypothetical protein
MAVGFLNSLVVNLGVSEFVIAVGANQQPFGHFEYPLVLSLIVSLETNRRDGACS